jgi:hypothetical protein
MTEWQIQRKLERFKIWQLENLLDGKNWIEPERDVKALDTLLRAGIKPSRRVMNRLVFCEAGHVDRLVSRIIARAEERTERNVSYRRRYAQKFYGCHWMQAWLPGIALEWERP